MLEECVRDVSWSKLFRSTFENITTHAWAVLIINVSLKSSLLRPPSGNILQVQLYLLFPPLNNRTTLP